MANSLQNISPQDCNNTVTKLFNEVSSSTSLTSDNLYNLWYFCSKGFESEENEKFSTPMVWIGVYMAVASFICIVCMVADSLLVRKERYQIPSKYFSLNVASMMVITIAMKLTVDLSGSMPGNLDQITKIGSIAFMCTIMAILNPSLASMNNKTLLSNIIGLAIFVITIAVNLLIQIGTGVINDDGPKNHISTDNNKWEVVEIVYYSFDFVYVACVYIGIMLFLLLISISTAIIIPSFKKVLEFKYQEKRKLLGLLNNDQKQQRCTVEELTQHVTKYWVMAKSGSPQFVMSCNLLSYTSLVLCVTGMCLYVYMLTSLHEENAYDGNFESNYKWSLSVILWTQVTGNVIGTVILVLRGFTGMKFKVHGILRSKDFRIFIVRKEKYWTQRLYEWRGSHSHLGFLSSHRHPIRSRSFIHRSKNLVLSLCIRLQFAFVQFNQLMVSPFIFIMEIIIKFEDASGCRFLTTPDHDEDDNGLKSYVLQLEDDVKPSQRVVKTISKSMDRLIETQTKRAETKQHEILLELLGKFNGFKGVVEFFDDDVTLDSWSVPVITLACIAIAVPDISKDKDQVKRLIESIDEALLYTHPVEESFDNKREFVDIRKTAITLWDDVRDNKHRWFGNPIGEGTRGKLPSDILNWFAAAEPIPKKTTGLRMICFPNESIVHRLIDIMHRITRSILSKNPAEIQTNERFFELLRSMIADILVACFSNIPRVIMMKCHANEIEKREASVVAAVKLLGRSTNIIEELKKCELPPGIDPDKMESIDKLLIHLKTSSVA